MIYKQIKVFCWFPNHNGVWMTLKYTGDVSLLFKLWIQIYESTVIFITGQARHTGLPMTQYV